MYENLQNVPEPFKKITPFSRVIPVNQEIEAGTAVHPYETISEYIKNSEYITVSQCYCRHHGELLDNPCKHPKEVCMAFGPNAKFVADRGFGRLVSSEEAMKILDETEKHGLVHCSSNTTKYIDFICNCCSCHCGIIQSFLESNAPSMAAISNFELSISEDDCIGCGDCVERCPVEALSLEDDIVQVDKRRCIGCGVCNVACPSDALSMKRRPETKEPPHDRKALQMSVVESLQVAMDELNEKMSD